MKKILVFALTAAALTVPCTYAESLHSEVSGNEIRISIEEGMSESVIAACYDENGWLTYAGKVTAADGVYTFEAPASYETVKLYDIGNQSYDVVLIEATPAPVSTPEPTLNPAYEKEADAVSAFAVVDKVVTTVNENNEEVYAITCLYQETEITVEVAQDIIIKSAPDAFSELRGADAMALEKGDVIYYETNLAGSRVRGLYLIYRPTNILEGSFYRYFTASNKAGGLWSVVPYGGKSPSGRYAYAFGIITEKYNNTLTLYSQTGLEEDSIEVDFTTDTVVYICDMEGKPQLEIAGTSGIKKSKISKSVIDEDDNIAFDTGQTYSIALVRLVDDMAADIVVYQDVEF